MKYEPRLHLGIFAAELRFIFAALGSFDDDDSNTSSSTIEILMSPPIKNIRQQPRDKNNNTKQPILLFVFV
jgi:hypothetical protein